MADNIVLLKDLEEHKFTLNYAEETNVRIGSTGTSTRPPFSDIVVWRIDEQEPQKEYHVKVLPNGIIFQGGVSAFLLPDVIQEPYHNDDSLWQLEPETPVPKELVFTRTPGTSEIRITPVFSATTHQQFVKMLGCLHWVKATP